MMLRRIVVVMGVALAVMPAMGQQESRPATTQAATPKELADKISAGIKLLDEKKYAELVEEWILPEQLAVAKKDDKSFNEFVASFPEKHAKMWMDAFKAMQGQTPKINADGTEAAYTIDGKLRVIVKEKGSWYFRM